MLKMYAPRRIDVHAHFIPDFYREAAEAVGITQPDGMPGWPDWSESETLTTMDRLDIATAMLSISSPGIRFGDDADARVMARRVNEAGAALVQAHPSRFGLFASLPLPDMAGSLDELRHALDDLHADGIILQTNYGGVYPGDAQLEPLMTELNERQAVVFVHPTAPPQPGLGQVDQGYPTPMLEFMFETTRAVTHLLLQGVLVRYPHIRWIIPHAGAALPVLIDRVAAQSPVMHLTQTVPPEDIYRGMHNLYYDLAGAPVPRTLAALQTLTTTNHLLYGSDYCFAQAAQVLTLQAQLDGAISADWQAIMVQNTQSLFPRLARLVNGNNV